jgi:hypothetical protein
MPSQERQGVEGRGYKNVQFFEHMFIITNDCI